MNLNDFAEDYVGPVLVTVNKVTRDKTRSGTEFARFALTVEGPQDGYKLDEHMDPTGFQLDDTQWLPMLSDLEKSDGEKKYKGKGLTVLKMFTAFGFTGDEDIEEMDWTAFEGLQAYCDLAPDRETGDPVVRYRSYKAI